MLCPTCQKDCASEFGLKSHMRSHKEATPAEPEPPKAEEKKPETYPFSVKETKGGFSLEVSGDLARVTDAGGKPLSKPMPYDKALRIFDRFATARR